MTRRLPLPALVLALVLLVAAAACSSDPGSEDAGADTTSTDADGSATPVDPQAEWVEHEAPPDCECAHGAPYSYWTRRAGSVLVRRGLTTERRR